MASIGRRFMEETTYGRMTAADQAKGLSHPPVEREASGARVTLPGPKTVRPAYNDVVAVIEERRSLREYADRPLELAEISYLLWCTQGVKNTVGDGIATLRTVPSAGARHPFETTLLVNRVAELEAGLYRYQASSHSLITLEAPGGIAELLAAACLGQAMVQSSAACFIWIADVYRTTWRYGERGYRYIHLDAGHVCQNLYLAAESIGAGACAIGAFSDADVNRLLGLDGVEQFAVYLAAVGKRVAAT